jgi:hypothetical protein
MTQSPQDLIASLVADLKPTVPLRQRDGMLRALVALAAGAAGFIGLYGMRPDLHAGHPDPVFLLASGLFLVLAIASSWMTVDLARPFVGSRRTGWGWAAMMAAVLPLSALVLVAADWLGGSTERLRADGLHCLQYGLTCGLVTAAVLTAWLRRGAPSLLGRAGLLAGTAAGSAGVFAVSLFCPENSLVHIGLWHGGTVILSALAGRLLLPRLIAW